MDKKTNCLHYQVCDFIDCYDCPHYITEQMYIESLIEKVFGEMRNVIISSKQKNENTCSENIFKLNLKNKYNCDLDFNKINFDEIKITIEHLGNVHKKKEN